MYQITMQNKVIAKRKCNRTRQVELQWHAKSDCQRSFITLEYKSAGKMQINVLSHVQPRHSMHADIILAQAETNLHNLPYSISDNATLSKSTHCLNNYAVRQNIGPDFFFLQNLKEKKIRILLFPAPALWPTSSNSITSSHQPLISPICAAEHLELLSVQLQSSNFPHSFHPSLLEIFVLLCLTKINK